MLLYSLYFTECQTRIAFLNAVITVVGYLWKVSQHIGNLEFSNRCRSHCTRHLLFYSTRYSAYMFLFAPLFYRAIPLIAVSVVLYQYTTREPLAWFLVCCPPTRKRSRLPHILHLLRRQSSRNPFAT